MTFDRANGGRIADLEGPPYERCLEEAERASRSTPPDERPSEADMLSACEDRYQVARRDTLTALIIGEWVRREAMERGIEVSGAKVDDAFAAAKSGPPTSRRSPRMRG